MGTRPPDHHSCWVRSKGKAAETLRRKGQAERRVCLTQAAYSSVLVIRGTCSYPVASAFLKKRKLCLLPIHMDPSTTSFPAHFGGRKGCRSGRGFTSGHRIDGASRFQPESLRDGPPLAFLGGCAEDREDLDPHSTEVPSPRGLRGNTDHSKG